MSRIRFPRLVAVVASAGLIAGAAVAIGPQAASPAVAAQVDVTLTPNPAYTGPTFQGWGTSLAWMANATGAYPSALRDDLVNKLFGDDGLRLNIARYNIGGGNASDVADYLRPGGAVPGWWNAQPPLTDAQGAITTSYVDRDRMLAAWTGTNDSDYDFSADPRQRAWIQAIKDKVTRWEAFSNSPPYFMTESGYVSGGMNASADQIKPEALAKFATYLKTVAEHVEASEGISFDTIDPLNEPNTNYWGTTVNGSGVPTGGGQEGAHASPALQAQVLNALQAELAKPATTTKTTVSGPDETNPSTFVSDWNGWDAAARSTVAQLNVHTYGTAERTQARDIAKAADKPLWMSEVEGDWGGNSWNPSSIENGLGIAGQITADLRELEPKAWVLWQPVEDLYNMQNVEKKNWGSVFIDFDCQADGTSARRVAAGDITTTCGVQVNSKYNTIRNFTHYIAPGDRIIPTNDANTTSAVSANGTGAVLVYTNTGTSARNVAVDLSRFGVIGAGATITPVVTTESPAASPTQNALVAGAPVTVDAASKSAVLNVPAKSVTTFIVSNVSGVAATAPGLADGARVKLTGVQSGKALSAAGTGVVISGYNSPDTAATQSWTATRAVVGDGTGRDQYLLKLDDGRVLSADSTGKLQIAAPSGDPATDPNARWLVNTTDGSAFSILNVGRQQVLDVGGQATSEGAPVGLWTSNGGGNQTFSIARAGGTATFPEATNDSLIAHDFTLYDADSGAGRSATSISGATLGLYQSRPDQPYGPDAALGSGSWGYVTTATGNPAVSGATGSTARADTVLVDAEPSGASLPAREVAYAFAIPNGTYNVTFGTKLPSGWGARSVELRAEGTTLGTITENGTEATKTYPVTVTDGRLDVSVHSVAGRTDGQADPVLSYVVVKTQTEWTTALLQQKLAATVVPDRSIFTDASLRALDAAHAAAQKVVDAASTDQDAIGAAYQALASAFASLQHKIASYTAFHPGQAWLDDGGATIQAHGGQVVPAKDANGRTIYYLYGEDRTNGYHSSPGVHVYSSYDLYNWSDQGVALRAMSSATQFTSDPYFSSLYGDYTQAQKDAVYQDLGTVPVAGVTPPIIERPKVIYNATTHKWVMWAHMDGPSATSTAQYAKAKAGVAISDSPFGPFRYIRSSYLDHSSAGGGTPGMARDMNLFVDDDGTGYIVYSSEDNATMYISKLNADYTDLATPANQAVEGIDYNRIFVGWSREAPAIFKYGGHYFLLTSGTSGWSPNPTKYARADDIMGAWTEVGNPFPWWAQSDSWNTQPTSVIPVDPAKGQFIYMGDRWNGGSDDALRNAPLVWLPINMGEGGDTFSIEVYDDWTLDQLDQWAAWDVLDAPTSLALGQAPTGTTVTVRQNGEDSVQPVTWTVTGAVDRPGLVTITGTLPGFGGRTFTRSVPVLPSRLVYVVNAGGQETADWKALINGARAFGPVLNAAADQAYGTDSVTGSKWGYLGTASGVTGDSSADIYTTLRYATSGSDLAYEFDGLRPGTYTVYAGYYDPWPWDARGADVTINGDLVEHDHAYATTDQSLAYANVVVGPDGRLTFSLAPTRGHDVQLSWLMVSATSSLPTVAASADARTVSLHTVPSGASGIEYRIDGAAWQTYAAPFTVPGTAAALVEYRATDRDASGPVSGMTLAAIGPDAVQDLLPLGTAKTVLRGAPITNLGAKVVDAGGNGVSGVDVVFTINGGEFAGGATNATVQSDAAGIAVAPTATAAATGSVTITAAFRTHATTLPAIQVVAPDPALRADVRVSSSVVGGKIVLNVSVTNAGTAAADVKIATKYGTKTFSAVAAGAAVSNGFKTMLASVPPGSVTVTLTGASGTSATTTAYGASQ